MLLIALVVWSVEAGAITGEFDQAGDTQGWRARESLFSGSGSGSGSLSLLRWEIRRGDLADRGCGLRRGLVG